MEVPASFDYSYPSVESYCRILSEKNIQHRHDVRQCCIRPEPSGTITVDIIQNDTGVTVYSEGITQPPRIFLYISNESGYIGPGYFENDTDYTASVSLGTGGYYNITLNFFTHLLIIYFSNYMSILK